jgi:biopolymer transport protein ExbD
MSMTPTNPAPLPAAGAPAGEGFVAPSTEATVHHEKKKKKAVAPTKMELNMTPMIDVVFQLLIYFIITCEFVAGEGILTATMPAGTGSADDIPKLEQQIKILVSSRGETGYRIDIDKSPTAPSTFGDLGKALEGMLEKNGGPFTTDNPIVIQPGGDVRWNHVVNAFNAALRAKYKNIAFGQVAESSE